MSAAPVIVLIASSFWLYNKDYKDFVPSFKYVKFNYAIDLMSLGFKFFIIQISVILLYQTSNMIIVQLFGPSEVTSYNIAFKYFSIVTMIFTIVLTPFWSAITEAYAKNDLTWIKKSIKQLQFFWIFIILLTSLMLLFSEPIYRLWIGNIVEASMRSRL